MQSSYAEWRGKHSARKACGQTTELAWSCICRAPGTGSSQIESTNDILLFEISIPQFINTRIRTRQKFPIFRRCKMKRILLLALILLVATEVLGAQVAGGSASAGVGAGQAGAAAAAQGAGLSAGRAGAGQRSGGIASLTTTGAGTSTGVTTGATAITAGATTTARYLAPIIPSRRMTTSPLPPATGRHLHREVSSGAK